MLNITELAEELHEITAWQETPVILELKDYEKMVKRAVRKFFVDINHPEEYDIDLFLMDDNNDILYNCDFMVDEIQYIIILCQLEFFQRVQMDVNNAFGYKTDALTITTADKPYANLQNTIVDLSNERRINFNKMVRYTLGES